MTASDDRTKILAFDWEVHMRSLLIAAAVAAAASLAGVAQTTASAAPPVDVVIHVFPHQFCCPELGVWDASGGIDDSGPYVRTFIRTSPPDRPFGVAGPFKEEFVLTGSQGTLTIKDESRDTGTEITGVWQIESGTGPYADASGHGRLTFSGGPPFVLTLTGVVSKVG